MSFKIRLFDADETLLDYFESEKFALQGLFNEIGYTGDFEKAQNIYGEINRNLWLEYEKGEISLLDLRKKRFDVLLNILQVKPPVENSSKIYLQHFAKAGILFEGADDFLLKLEKLPGVNILLTNGYKSTQRSRFEIAGLSKYFSEYIISEELNLKKPDYEIFEYALKDYTNIDKNEIIMIGDNLISDISGGNNYGIKTCWINFRAYENNTEIIPDFVVNNYNELYNILSS